VFVVVLLLLYVCVYVNVVFQVRIVVVAAAAAAARFRLGGSIRIVVVVVGIFRVNLVLVVRFLLLPSLSPALAPLFFLFSSSLAAFFFLFSPPLPTPVFPLSLLLPLHRNRLLVVVVAASTVVVVVVVVVVVDMVLLLVGLHRGRGFRLLPTPPLLDGQYPRFEVVVHHQADLIPGQPHQHSPVLFEKHAGSNPLWIGQPGGVHHDVVGGGRNVFSIRRRVAAPVVGVVVVVVAAIVVVLQFVQKQVVADADATAVGVVVVVVVAVPALLAVEVAIEVSFVPRFGRIPDHLVQALVLAHKEGAVDPPGQACPDRHFSQQSVGGGGGSSGPPMGPRLVHGRGIRRFLHSPIKIGTVLPDLVFSGGGSGSCRRCNRRGGSYGVSGGISRSRRERRRVVPRNILLQSIVASFSDPSFPMDIAAAAAAVILVVAVAVITVAVVVVAISSKKTGAPPSVVIGSITSSNSSIAKLWRTFLAARNRHGSLRL